MGDVGLADRVAVEGDAVGVEDTESESERAGMGVGRDGCGNDSSVGLMASGGDLRDVVSTSRSVLEIDSGDGV